MKLVNNSLKAARRKLWLLAFTALGVVFGDIGTSPIYAIRECFHGAYAISITRDNVLGVLSLIVWALLLIVSFKYMLLVLRANNRGEGGVIAITALLMDGQFSSPRVRMTIIALGVFAACLLYGDGMITPAISVLSAVEGMSIITPALGIYVIPATVLILVCLFALQSYGTTRIGSLFSPVILLWMVFISCLGIAQIIQNPMILSALLPWYAVGFLIANKLQGFVVLGAVFLVVTGTEALYADMGHFGAKPIRITWFYFVFPALLLNYFGQGALLLNNPKLASHPFYAMVPPYLLTVAVILATMATIIASQAVISGAFSLTRQAIQLGFFPRLKISHTSSEQIGQIYIGPINWMLMICTVCLVLVFKSSGLLAGAYGVAVTSTMLVTSILFYYVSRVRFKWSKTTSIILLVILLSIDIPFFCANFSKIFHGAWLPLVIGIIFFIVMWTWKKGREALNGQIQRKAVSFEAFRELLVTTQPAIVDGCAVFLVGRPIDIPIALLQNLSHNKVIHRCTIILHISTLEIPRVDKQERIKIVEISSGMYKITASVGFMESIDIEDIMHLVNEKGMSIDLNGISYFLGRERLFISTNNRVLRCFSMLFAWISRNTTDISTFYNIPSNQIIEVGVPLEI
jgi:KUP system potassium uptake protein